jgi:Zn-dependent peptidase ImmA (M78 family)
MRRGFKKEALEISREIRSELGLRMLDPLDPWRLAEHLEIPVWRFSEYLSSSTHAIATLTGVHQSAFSAMVVFHGHQRTVIHNDSHTLPRQRANIAHELAHALLLHQPHAVRAGSEPHFDVEQEDEASWLGGTLLVTEDACLAACRRSLAERDAAAEMGVSEDLMRWRINATGARKRVARARRLRHA